MYLHHTCSSDEDDFVDALLYLSNKSQMLEDSATTHSPVKLQWFTKTGEGYKFIITDMVNITVPDQSEYSFQFKKLNVSRKTMSNQI